VSETVFILGAGASKQAGGPLMREFLDVAEALRPRAGAAFAGDFDLVFAGIAELRVAQSKASVNIDNIESVFAAFELAALLGTLGALSESDTRGLAPAMRRVIARTLEMRIGFRRIDSSFEPPAPYNEFLRYVQKLWPDNTWNSVSLMTFNYDIALDYALHYNSVAIDYCLKPEPVSGRVQLMKLHGSLNWGRCIACEAIEEWPVSLLTSSTPGFSWAPGAAATAEFVGLWGQRRHCHPLGLYAPDPVIVPPTWDKASHYGEIETVWRRAARHLGEAKDIVVIGYSLPESDQFFRYLYALGTLTPTRLRRFVVYDPDASDDVKNRFQRLLGQAAQERFTYRRLRFAEAIADLPIALARD
jgi:hypothetical protein